MMSIFGGRLDTVRLFYAYENFMIEEGGSLKISINNVRHLSTTPKDYKDKLATFVMEIVYL